MAVSKMKTIDKNLWIPIGIAVIAILIFYLVSLKMPVVSIFIPGVIAAFIVYYHTYYRHTAEPTTVLPLYLVCLAIQCLHFAEEYIGNFTTVLPNQIGQDAYDLKYWLIFNMAAYSVFILGAVVIYKKKTAFMIIPIFFILIGVLFNPLGHIALSVYMGDYFPGLYSALLYLIVGPILIRRIWLATKRSADDF